MTRACGSGSPAPALGVLASWRPVPPSPGAGRHPFRSYEAQVDDDEHLIDLTPMVPMMLPPHWDEPESFPMTRRSSPTPARPAYGLVGVPDQAVTTRDIKVLVGGFSLGAVVAVLFSWFGRGGRHVG